MAEASKMISGDYEPHFSLKHMFKDVQLGIHMANALDIEIPATTVTAGVMYGALNQNWGDLDFSVLFKNYTPTESFDELPALEQALRQPGALAESSESPSPAMPPVVLTAPNASDQFWLISLNKPVPIVMFAVTVFFSFTEMVAGSHDSVNMGKSVMCCLTNSVRSSISRSSVSLAWVSAACPHFWHISDAIVWLMKFALATCVA